jgi:predicted membrane protein
MITVGLFGDRRIGHRAWRPGKRVWCVNVFGDTLLDFSEAELASPSTRVWLLNFFGDTDVVVAPSTSLTVGGLTIFGDRNVKRATCSTSEIPSNEHNLSLTDVSIFGDVTIRDPAGV